MADKPVALQNAVDVVCSGLKEIGLLVATSETEFRVFGLEIASNDTIQVGPATISSSSSLRYLGLPFGTSIRSTRQLIIVSLKEKLRTSYGLLARVKGQFDKRTLGQLYNAFFAPHVLFLIPFLEICFYLIKSKSDHFPLGSVSIFLVSLFGLVILTFHDGTVFLRFVKKWTNSHVDLLTAATELSIFHRLAFYQVPSVASCEIL